MYFCVNCNQNVECIKQVSGPVKALAGILSTIIFMFGTMLLFSGMYSGYVDIGTYLFLLTLIISISIPILAYYKTPRKCPLCKVKQISIKV